MTAKPLLILTAVLELSAAAALLFVPSLAAELLLGAELVTPAALIVGRIAGAALLSIGLTCWLERGGGAQSGLVFGLLAYNVSVAVLLAYAGLGEHMHGIALWPAVGLHAALSIWCVACLRSNHL